MGLYPVAVVLQYTHPQKRTGKTHTHTQNYKHNKVHVLHTLKTQNEYLNITKNLK